MEEDSHGVFEDECPGLRQERLVGGEGRGWSGVGGIMTNIRISGSLAEVPSEFKSKVASLY